MGLLLRWLYELLSVWYVFFMIDNFFVVVILWIFFIWYDVLVKWIGKMVFGWVVVLSVIFKWWGFINLVLGWIL